MTSRPELPEGSIVLRERMDGRVLTVAIVNGRGEWGFKKYKYTRGDKVWMNWDDEYPSLTADEILRLAEHVKGVQRG